MVDRGPAAHAQKPLFYSEAALRSAHCHRGRSSMCTQWNTSHISALEYSGILTNEVNFFCHYIHHSKHIRFQHFIPLCYIKIYGITTNRMWRIKKTKNYSFIAAPSGVHDLATRRQYNTAIQTSEETFYSTVWVTLQQYESLFHRG